MVRIALKKAAFTMIELIFAIVIIAISVLTLPMIARVTSVGIENNILQEAIFAGSAELMEASSGYWDENSMEDMNFSHISRVIDTNLSCVNNNANIRHRLKPGHIAQPFHRRCLDNNLTIPTDTNDTGGITNVFDLDDAEHPIADIFTDNNTTATGYKDTYRSTIDVNRTGNVKFITVTVSESAAQGGADIVVLRLQSANIGEIDYFKRRF